MILPVQTVLVQLLIVKLGLPVSLALWKEVVAGIILLLGLYQLTQRIIKRQVKLSSFDFIPIWLVSGMTVVGLLTSVSRVPINYIVYGFRFELFWLWLWCILVTWWQIEHKFEPESLFKNLRHLILPLVSGFLLVISFGLSVLAFGPQAVFSSFGYGLNSGSELLVTQQQGHQLDAVTSGTSYRLNATFSSPNHLAAYLLLILPVLIFFVFSSNARNKEFFLDSTYPTALKKMLANRFFWRLLLGLNILFLVLTFARYVYLIAAVFLLSYGLFRIFQQNLRLKHLYRFGILLVLILPLALNLIVLNIPSSTLSKYLPLFLAKPASTDWHQQHSFAALRALQTTPTNWVTGFGMGTTDPASKYLPLDTNPLVKVGIGDDDEQYFARVIDRPLALTPENWYLGLWLKGGIGYVLFFILITFFFIKDIRLLFQPRAINIQEQFRVLTAMALFGLFLGATILDLFDSQSVALLIGPVWLIHQVLSQNLTQYNIGGK